MVSVGSVEDGWKTDLLFDDFFEVFRSFVSHVDGDWVYEGACLLVRGRILRG